MLVGSYRKKVTILSSQKPVDKWYDVIDEETIADAIMDRLLCNAHRLELKGEPLRKKKRKKIFIMESQIRSS